jgi:primosomal protein N' (replication factor Y)
MAKDKTKSLFGVEADEVSNASGQVVRVALDNGADSVFDYVLPEAMGTVQAGQRVQVPFGKANKLVNAFVVRVIATPSPASGGYSPLAGGELTEAAQCRKFRLKNVKSVVDEQPLLNDQLMQLAQWISQYYVCPLGQVLSAMVPAAVKQDSGVKKQAMVYLSAGQGGMVEKLTSSKQKTIAGILQEANAVDADSAMSRDALLELAGCTEAPLKQLVRKQIVCVYKKEVLHVPAVKPTGLAAEVKEITLNTDQQKAVDFIAGEIDAGRFGVSLLHGVTDSGKTEVYIRAIKACIEAGKQAIILLPEIALTAQTVQRFSSRFERIAIMHSQLSGPQRNAQWQKIRQGQADVVIGARSAIFAPLSRLGLVVVDEEHEPSYKQDTVPRYHGRDVAVMRAHTAGAHCVLGSATPSLESLYNCRTKKHYTLLELPKRVMDLPMPRMKMVDMTTAFADTEHKGVHLISPVLREHLSGVLERKEQAILLLNRRGYSHFIFCPACKHSLTCRNCDVTLTFHKKPHMEGQNETVLGRHKSGGFAVCHYCLSKTLVPKQCPICGVGMSMIGLGSQRLEEELTKKLPKARIRRIDSDSMEGEDYYTLLKDFTEQKIDILAGTQILAKGLHFPNVTLVGIISADTALFLPDFRANERTFQIISQVAGRAGRSEKKGIVLVQTLMSRQPAIEFAVQNDYKGFVEQELQIRQSCGLPPFGRQAVVAMRDAKYDRLKVAAEMLKERIDGLIAAEKLAISVRGPLEPAISRIQRQHRLNIILLSPAASALQQLFERLRRMSPLRPAVQTYFDIDPIGVL